MCVVIRPYKSMDHESILSIYSLSKLDELQFENESFELLPLNKDKRRYDQLFESDIFVYESDNHNRKIIAYGAVFGSEVRALFVAPDARGRGVGQALFEYLLQRITGVASLYVAKLNYPAKALYYLYGFKVVDEFTTFYNGVPVLANKMLREC